MAETTQWRPAAGQIALIEPVDASPGRDCLTGVVVPGDRILIDLGASPRPESDAAEVVASFVAPDALYRLFAKAHQEADGLVSLDVSALERVQRRANPRVQVALPVRLGVGDQVEAAVLSGETVDLSTHVSALTRRILRAARVFWTSLVASSNEGEGRRSGAEACSAARPGSLARGS